MKTIKQLRRSDACNKTARELRADHGPAVHQRTLAILDQPAHESNDAAALAVADYYMANRPSGIDMTWPELAGRYCARQNNTPRGLLTILQQQRAAKQPDGWMLLECQVLDGNRCGELTVVPYGPRNTLQQPATGPVSPRGLASDMSVVIGLLNASQLPL